MTRKQTHPGAHFPGVDSTTGRSDPESGSRTDLASFVHSARRAVPAARSDAARDAS